MTGSCPVSAHVCQETVRERDELRRWKAEALPVLSGLQELGKALGLPLGSRTTGSRGTSPPTGPSHDGLEDRSPAPPVVLVRDVRVLAPDVGAVRVEASGGRGEDPQVGIVEHGLVGGEVPRELGKALGLPLGSRITGTEALAAVERLTRERDEARAEVERLRAGIEALTYVLGPGLPRGRRTDRRVWDATRSASEMAHDLLNPTEGETDE